MEITKAQAEAIKATLSTQGWELIEQLLIDKFVENRRPKSFVGLKKKTDAQIASEMKAVEIACNSINGFITRLKFVSNQKNKKEERYV